MRHCVLALALFASGAACSGGSGSPDGSSPPNDAASSASDAAVGVGDGGAVDAQGDAGLPPGPREMLVGFLTWGQGPRGAWVAALGAGHVPQSAYQVSDSYAPGGLPRRLRFTPDGSRFLYEAGEDAPYARDLFAVDVSSEVPGPNLNATANLDGSLIFADRSPTSGRALCLFTPVGSGSGSGDLVLADVDPVPPPLAAPVSDPPLRVDDVIWMPTGTSALFIATSDSQLPDRVYHVRLGDPPFAPVRVRNVAVAGGTDWVRVAPDSSKFLVFANQGLFLVDLGTGSPGTPAPLDAGLDYAVEAEFTSDSRWVVLRGHTGAERRLYAIDVSGSAPGPLVELTTPDQDDVLSFSVAGQKVIYQVEGSPDLPARHEWIDLSGASPGDPVEVMPILPGEWLADLFFSPDGQTMVASAFDGNGDRRLYVADTSGTAPGALRRIAGPMNRLGDQVGPRYSPDSRRILFAADSDLDDQLELLVVDLAAADPQPVVVSGPMIAGAMLQTGATPIPGFTPDGEAVLFVVNAEDLDHYDLYVVDVAGSAPGPRYRVNLPFDVDLAGVHLDGSAVSLR
jgi:dipeptidyl aminopeptidase/acylaminoacyl peptidase